MTNFEYYKEEIAECYDELPNFENEEFEPFAWDNRYDSGAICMCWELDVDYVNSIILNIKELTPVVKMK